MSALDTQIGGDHYKGCKIQPVQYAEANDLRFLEACVVKRVTRHDKPTGKGRQDIEKAIHELQLLLEHRYPLPTVTVRNFGGEFPVTSAGLPEGWLEATVDNLPCLNTRLDVMYPTGDVSKGLVAGHFPYDEIIAFKISEPAPSPMAGTCRIGACLHYAVTPDGLCERHQEYEA